jgi:hypothetical protein
MNMVYQFTLTLVAQHFTMKKLIIAISLFISSFVKAQDCPGISVFPYSDEITAGDTLIITCVAKFIKTDVTYNWTISAGTIISGQGTARILVNTKEASGMFITATVEIKGLPAKCPNVASASAEVIPGAQLAVKGTFTNGQELKNAVQQFIAATGFKDTANTGTAFIYLYKAPNTTESAFNIFKQAIITAFEYNKIPPGQYIIADGGTKNLASYEIYLLARGMKEPLPTNQ